MLKIDLEIFLENKPVWLWPAANGGILCLCCITSHVTRHGDAKYLGTPGKTRKQIGKFLKIHRRCGFV